MTSNLRAIFLCFTPVVVVMACSRAEEEDERPLRVLSSDELAPPVLVCSPRTLSLTASEDVVKTFRITVENAGGRVLHWSVASAPVWAVPEARSGKVGFRGKGDVVFTIDSARLRPGTTRGVILIEAPGVKGSPARISMRVAYAAKSEERARDTRRPEPRPVERPVSDRKPYWRLSYGVPVVGGLAGVSAEPGWRPGPMLFAEKHWGSHAQHSFTASFLRFAKDAVDEVTWVWEERIGDYTEFARVSYRRYTSPEASARVFLELGVVTGELDVSGTRFGGPWYQDSYESTETNILLGLGLRFRGRGGRSPWFMDMSLGLVPGKMDYELFGRTHSVKNFSDVSLMFGWSVP